jgi:hypothetical protein
MNLLSATFLSRSCAVLSIIGFLYALVIGLQVRDENRVLMDKGIQSARHVGKEAQGRIENTLMHATGTIEEQARNLLANRQKDTEQFLAPIRKIMYSDPGFVKAGVAFAPFAYDPKIRLHGFSYVVDGEGMQLHDLDINEDYTKPDVVWYNRAMKGEKGWLEPVYDEIQHRMLVTYVTPIYQQGESGEPMGVVFATYSISSFKQVLDNMNLGKNGYSFLLSPAKRYIVHHDQDYLDHRWSLDDFLGRLHDKSVGRAVTAALGNPSRIVRLTDPDSGQDSRVLFLQIPEAAWTLGIMLDDNDLMMPPSAERIKLLRLVLVICLAIFLLAIPLSAINQNLKGRLWILSNVFTVCCIIGNVAALGLTAAFPPDNVENSFLITNQNSLNRFMSDQRHRILEQTGEVPFFIPTGIYVQSISYNNSGGTISINGYVWQRYTLGVHDGVERGFMIPGSTSFKAGEPQVTRSGNTELVRWNFNATLYQDFNYKKYPFSREYIQVPLQHKQFTRNIILVPDLESYKITNPEALPGLKNNLYLRGWDSRRSYFGYRFENYKTSFGLASDMGKTDFPSLFLTIEVSKQIFGALISQFLPLAVVSILLFALLLVSTNMKGEKLEVIEGIAACAAFFIVIVFAHIGLRQSFAVKDIIYLEYYYYIVYVMILFTVGTYVSVAVQKEQEQMAFTPGISHSNLFRQRGLYAQLLFWPLSQLTILLLTLQEFY